MLDSCMKEMRSRSWTSISEHVEWNTTDEAIAEAANKAVCTLISQVRTCGGLGFGTFSKLFDSCVQSIMSYEGGVWGIYECKHVTLVWFRACRYYLGVGKFHPKAAICWRYGVDPDTL